MSASTSVQTACPLASRKAPDTPGWVAWIAVCILIGSFAGCGTDKLGPAEAPVAAVTVSPARATGAPGGSVPLTGVAKNASGTKLPGRAITSSTRDTPVAKDSPARLVPGAALGLAADVATSGPR